MLCICTLICMIQASRHILHISTYKENENGVQLFKRQISILKVINRFCFYCDN